MLLLILIGFLLVHKKWILANSTYHFRDLEEVENESSKQPEPIIDTANQTYNFIDPEEIENESLE